MLWTDESKIETAESGLFPERLENLQATCLGSSVQTQMEILMKLNIVLNILVSRHSSIMKYHQGRDRFSKNVVY